jgi:hypothetical protein
VYKLLKVRRNNMNQIQQIITKTNGKELETLISKYNSLLDELKETTEKIISFKLKVETMPLIEVMDTKM